MKKKSVIVLGGCLFLISVIMISLYLSSILSEQIRRSSFERKFGIGPSLAGAFVKDLKYNSYYISGLTRSNIFLSNYTNPFHLLKVNLATGVTQAIRLQVVGMDSIVELDRFRTKVDSPYFFLIHGISPCLLRGKLGDWKGYRFMADSAYFVAAEPISPSSFVLRSYSNRSNGYELAKESMSRPFLKFNYDLLEKQIDGVFCVEGRLHFSKKLNRLVYLYSYRNEFIVADTNLNLVHRYHTIDTFRHARIKVVSVKSRKSLMLASPPTRINSVSCLSGKYLFIRSNLLAKNGDLEKFRRSSIIDVYNFQDGGYVNSFYLSNYKGHVLMDFKVSDGRLAALFDRYLVIYKRDAHSFADWLLGSENKTVEKSEERGEIRDQNNYR